MQWLDFENDADFELMPETEEKEILQNIRFIVLTRKGSVPMARDFGVDWDFLDKPINEARLIAIPEIISEVQTREPRAEISQVVYDGVDAENGKIFLKLLVNFRV